jgi:chromate transporter
MNRAPAALLLSAHLAFFSLISFGGIPVVLPAIHALVVDAKGWVDDREFADFFALSQILPGPNFIFMLSLIGWKIGGPFGAATAALGIAGPSGVLTFCAFRVWHRFRDARWRQLASRGLVPVTIGLVVAGGWVLARTADNDWRGLAMTAVTAALAVTTRINPLWLLGAAAVVGGLGLVRGAG